LTGIETYTDVYEPVLLFLFETVLVLRTVLLCYSV